MTERRGRGRPPSAANEIARLERALTPATDAEVEKAVDMLLAVFPMRGAGGPLLAESYRMGLCEVSAQALALVTRVILQGLDDAIDPRLLPTPAEIARLCRKIDQPKLDALMQAKAEQAKAEQEAAAAKRPAEASRRPVQAAEASRPADGADGAQSPPAAGVLDEFRREVDEAADREGAGRLV